ncbi:CLUMA_CG003403, isoform A [Clunio marinus]|uniref:Dol-P-Glc:Glc(2)Man(9)GlcNAc(2)-PP-Dol alpha-1,2-glucosyltransferase n=1 Tax=Clunio marinus TaxID=568069 RepID=A0A1J1HNR3_9DIPT|nr:CLUMA_CG003403, isoform A [Clunio marinus]
MDRFLKYLFISIYSIISIIIFQKVFETSGEVIDELFHIRQGLKYCQGNFSEWDSKITTFPGLYLLSSFIPTEYCETYTLRLIPLICSFINILLIYEIKSLILYDAEKENNHDVLLETMALATLPPMYFFSHVYYTDVPSITMILFMLLFSILKHHKLSAIFGAFSVIMRQTNVIWVAGTLGVHLIDKMMLKIYPKMKRETATFDNFLFALKSHLKHPKILLEFIVGSISEYFGYFVIIFSFMAFVFINGSIVVGDKTAHEASIHIPQLYYFSLFVLVFGCSLWLPQLFRLHKIFSSWKCLLGIFLLTLFMILTVKYNTLVHPYLLADNRHYTFYVWKRFYQRHALAKYAIIPVYIFGLSTIFTSMDGSIGFKIFFVLSTIATLCLQKLIEVRYFLIPFLLLKLNRKSVTKSLSLLELLVNILINQITFIIFFQVQVRWKDFNEVQRIIW